MNGVRSFETRVRGFGGRAKTRVQREGVGGGNHPFGRGLTLRPRVDGLGALGLRFGAIFLFWGYPLGRLLFFLFRLLYPYFPSVAVLCISV